jgi:hypothetical protein
VAGQQKAAVNLLLHHGVRTCLEYQRTGDAAAARRLSNPDLAPHLSFLDMGGHGYAVLRLTADAVQCEFVCIPRPSEPTSQRDGGPIRTASCTARHGGRPAGVRVSNNGSSKAIRTSQCERRGARAGDCDHGDHGSLAFTGSHRADVALAVCRSPAGEKTAIRVFRSTADLKVRTTSKRKALALQQTRPAHLA